MQICRQIGFPSLVFHWMWNPSRSLKLGFLIYKTKASAVYFLALLLGPLPLPSPQLVSLCSHLSAILTVDANLRVCMLCHGRPFATPRTVVRQASSSMGFSGQECWSSCHFLLQGIFPTRGSHLHLLHWQADSLPLRPLGSPTDLLSPYFLWGIMLSTWQVFAFVFLHKNCLRLMFSSSYARWPTKFGESYVQGHRADQSPDWHLASFPF